MLKFFLSFLVFLLPLQAYAQEKVVNVYSWAGEVPDFIVRQFEKETGIKVNISYFENNEILYTKLRTMKHAGYDVINPSSYFVDRMRNEDMLEKLDRTKLSNWNNLDPTFTNPAYDPGSLFSLPHVWGITGMFINSDYYLKNSVKKWSDLWDDRFYNQLMLLDDMREIFSMGLLTLGYSANDRDPAHIREAFLKLKSLMQNVKVFSSDTTVSIMIDEDVTAGMVWNGDALKASQENPMVKFIFPEEGFVIWVDTFAIPKNAPHKDAAYAFMNFMLRPDIAKQVTLSIGFPTANLTAQKLLPEAIRNNPAVYPPKEIMRRGEFQRDLNDKTLEIYEKYWEELKMSG